MGLQQVRLDDWLCLIPEKAFRSAAHMPMAGNGRCKGSVSS